MPAEVPEKLSDPENVDDVDADVSAVNDDSGHTLSEAVEHSDNSVTPDTHKTVELRQGKLPTWIRWLWFGWPDIRQTVKMLIASVVMHVVFTLLLVLLGINTNIVEMQIEWSEQQLTGLGTWADPATAMVPFDPETLGNENGEEDADDTMMAEVVPEPPPDPVPEPLPVEPIDEPEPAPEPPPETDDKTAVMAVPADPDVEAPATVDPADEVAVVDVPDDPPIEEPQESPPDDPEVAETEPDPPEDNPAAIPDVDSLEAAPTTDAERIADALADAAAPKGQAAAGEEDKAGHVAENLPGLEEYGPGNVRLIVLVRMDRLRGTSFEDASRQLFENFPDYQLALSGSGVDPMTEFDAVLVATNNPGVYHETFLAVRHSLTEKRFKKIVAKSFPGKVEWTNHKGHPLGKPQAGEKYKAASASLEKRWLYLPEPGLALWVQPRLLKQIHEVPAIQPPSEGDDADAELAQRSILQSLQAIEEVDGAAGTEPSVFVMVRGIKGLKFAGLPELTTPMAITASLSTNTDNPRFISRFEFESEQDATNFMLEWPDFVAATSDVDVMGLTSMLEALTMEREGNLVYTDGELSGFMTRMLLVGASVALPDVRPEPSE